MAKKLAAPKNLRNGLKWRDGRPRWEPSPANRKLGIGGMDLKGEDGAWLDRGGAINAADARHLWASLIRESAREGKVGSDARADLALALEGMDTPATPEARQARRLVADLLATASKLLGGSFETVQTSGSPRSVQAMVEGYLADPEVTIKPASRRQYTVQSRKLIARFGNRKVGDVTRGMIRTWYLEMTTGLKTNPVTGAQEPTPEGKVSLSVAHAAIGTAASFFKWAMHKDWINASPCSEIKMTKPEGRRVFWTVEEELSFIPWCDANGYEDIADAVIFGLWTAASPVDLCKPNVEDLAGQVWRYKREKTGVEAVVEIMAPLRQRIERRRRSAASAGIASISGTPFIFDFRSGRRHDAPTLSRRFRIAKTEAIAAGAAPASLAEKRLQDMRDTCITRLYEADVPIDKIPSWTGHSPSEAGEILREHYIVLRNEGAADQARALEGWAQRNGLMLAAK